ncbi:Dolichyldiphosphatase 1 [Mizuhopecten yessoensis]|uniref:Dolichyldiphosphatase 1 n=1 Tax=Mizuhopecten yessoensis TaxID=6573 RepID=A0A210PTV2_MIZYE|nr:Dolichyldiphosphatase 1 [Mizuhopecten yessoensis]
MDVESGPDSPDISPFNGESQILWKSISLTHISYFTGLLLNEAINWVLKHLIQAPRPVRNRQLYTEYGMPSSHAQFSWFFSTYMILFLFLRIYKNYNLIDDVWKYCVSAICVIGSSIVLYSRVYLGYHTIGQVSCGTLLGVFFGAAWFCTVCVILTPFFPILASSPIGADKENPGSPNDWAAIRSASIKVESEFQDRHLS